MWKPASLQRQVALEEQISRLSRQLEEALERERLFREDFSRRLLDETLTRERFSREDFSWQLEAEMRGFVDDRVHHWACNRSAIALPVGAPIATHTLDGHRILLDPTEPFITLHVMEHGCWEKDLREVLRHLLREGGHYVDVGANIGLHALFVRTLVGSSGKIIALEPHPNTRNLLRKNLEINGLSNCSGVRVLEIAAAETHGEMRNFEYFPQHSAMSGFSVPPDRISDFQGTPEVTEVMTGRLDRIIEEQGISKSVIKIDVEGFEPKVIDGLGDILKLEDVAIIIEFNDNLMISSCGEDAPLALFNKLRGFGLCAYAIDSGGLYAVETLSDLTRGCDVLFVRQGGEYHDRSRPLIDKPIGGQSLT